MRNKLFMAIFLLLVSIGIHGKAFAIAFGTDFAGKYTDLDLGSVPGLPTSYGGLTFKPGDPNTIWIGGNANTANGRIYEIGVTRNATNHITGFSGTATSIGNVGEYNDGGVTVGPGGVLFTSRWPVNELGQTKPGDTDESKIIDLAALGVAGSHAAINFVPAGFDGAGQMKLVSWSGGQWYTGNFSQDGSGTFDLLSVTQETTIGGGPEGFVYIDGINLGFTVDSLLVAEWSAGNVAAYAIDSNGDPIVSSRRDFITGLSGAEGAAIDPLTGDFLFSTFGGGNHVVAIQGFVPPPPPPNPGVVPEPATLLLLCIGLAGVIFRVKRDRSSSRLFYQRAEAS
ncbi:PEP-CTERM sorting domain-containing protein [Nitrosomonas marina]|uniref:PEP-CTERM protein-sorting domain-containing protein n=1 Tax=Nitrosomonas marina TaxID=917 RepID=A0A1H8CQ33_9PROT|nr:PEP-CTERM sorting domain-containing protein [Nitrosomonas marina]SEM97263.1 PEP-CTERM protein-sorting domain-containing protein [Nitrosomonas marina]